MHRKGVRDRLGVSFMPKTIGEATAADIDQDAIIDTRTLSVEFKPPREYLIGRVTAKNLQQKSHECKCIFIRYAYLCMQSVVGNESKPGVENFKVKAQSINDITIV